MVNNYELPSPWRIANILHECASVVMSNRFLPDMEYTKDVSIGEDVFGIGFKKIAGELYIVFKPAFPDTQCEYKYREDRFGEWCKYFWEYFQDEYGD